PAVVQYNRLAARTQICLQPVTWLSLERAPHVLIFCVSTVSIVCAIKAPVPFRAQDGLHPAMSTVIADAADGADDVRDVSSPITVILIVRVPDRPSRSKTISIPSTRRKVCVRRSRPASARGSLWPAGPVGDAQPAKGRM